jgi:integrase
MVTGVHRRSTRRLSHTHATVGPALGVPAKAISERLGHERVVLTLKQYADVLPGMQSGTARLIAPPVVDQGDNGFRRHIGVNGHRVI